MNQEHNLKQTFQSAHDSAAKEAAAVMPKIELRVLVQLLVDVVEKKKTPQEAAMFLAKQYKAPMEVYLKVFTRFFSEEGLNYLLLQAKSKGVNDLAGTDFKDNMIDATCKAGILAAKYYKNEINGMEFLEELYHSGLVDVGKQYAGAIGVDVPDLQSVYSAVANASVLSLSYACIAESYAILMKAMEDASIQHETTLRVQTECKESVALIQQYRKEMEDVVSKYLIQHLQSFETGFQTMDQAILDDDVDGYLKGNAELQKALGREVQFETKDEFDDFMSSDTPFKL